MHVQAIIGDLTAHTVSVGWLQAKHNLGMAKEKLSAYERKRNENVKRNEEVLKKLGLAPVAKVRERVQSLDRDQVEVVAFTFVLFPSIDARSLPHATTTHQWPRPIGLHMYSDGYVYCKCGVATHCFV